MQSKFIVVLIVGVVVSLTVMFSDLGLAIDANDKSIVAYYGFEEGKGDIAKDTSKNDNKGDIKGNAQWTKGKFGSAILFDGKDDYVEVPLSPSFGLEKLSVLFWMYPDTIGGNNPANMARPFPWTGKSTLIVSNSIRGLALDWGFEWWNDGSLYWVFWGAGGAKGDVGSPVNEVNKWYYIAVTYDGNVAKLYINGELKTSKNVGVEVNPGPRPLAIASAICPGGWGCDSGYFKGIIDEVGIFNKALSDGEVKQVMDGALSGASAVSSSGKLAISWGKIKIKI